MTKSDKLREMLYSKNLEFLMEAHSGISAVIAEEAGFKGLWASGLSMSAMTGCRDRNELDLSEVCKIIEWMADHTSIPILVDGDTGGVDPNSARIMVNKLVKAGAAGVCIEDKLYPKHNSFLSNTGDDLSDPYFHANKIIEMKKECPNFVVVARLESFIAGQDVDEAVRRAVIYQNAGADAILVHSKRKDCDDIRRFMSRWNADKYRGEIRKPVIIVPTKYYTTPTEEFYNLGVSTVIWANHQMRASINAMKDVCKTIYSERSLVSIEKQIAPVSEIFRLQKDDELVKKEEGYLPVNQGSAIILSATSNKLSRHDTPKCFESVSGNYLIDFTETSLKERCVNNVILVLGEGVKEDHFSYDYLVNTKVVLNRLWDRSSEVYSLKLGLEGGQTRLPLYIVYGDLLFTNSVYEKLCKDDLSDSDIVIGIDSDYNIDDYNEFVSGDFPKDYTNLSWTTNVFEVSDSLPDNNFVGSFVGVVKVNTAKGLNILHKAVESVSEEDLRVRLHKVLNIATKECKVKGVYIDKSEWVDINKSKDLIKGEKIINGKY